MSCPTKGIVSNPIISEVSEGYIAFATALKICARVCQEVIFIGSKNEHVVDVDLTYFVYEAV